MAIMMFDIPRNCVTFAHKTLRMSRKRKPNPILEGITIEAVAAEGKSMFHHDERVVFVPFCVPGDVVEVEIVRKTSLCRRSCHTLYREKQSKGRTILQTLRHLRWLQMAEFALCRTVESQTTAGIRPVIAYR